MASVSMLGKTKSPEAIGGVVSGESVHGSALVFFAALEGDDFRGRFGNTPDLDRRIGEYLRIADGSAARCAES